MPYIAAAVLDLVFVAAVLRLLSEDRPPREGSVARALAAGARAVPSTVVDAVRLSVTDRPMRLVLLLTAVGGVGLVGCELLGPVRFADLAGGTDDGAAVYGVVLAPLLRRGGGRGRRDAGAAPTAPRLDAHHLRRPLGARCGRAGAVRRAGPARGRRRRLRLYYVAHGATWPLLSAVLHTRVTAAHRATAVSAMSLAMALGGILGNLVVPGLAEAVSLEAALLVVAAVVLLGAVACFRLPHSTRDEAAIAAETTAVEAPA